MSNPLLRLFGSSKDTRYQDATTQADKPYEPSDDGNTIQVGLTTVATNYAHKLGRKYSGFSTVRNDGSLTIEEQSSPDPKLFIRLRCTAGSGAVVIRVY